MSQPPGDALPRSAPVKSLDYARPGAARSDAVFDYPMLVCGAIQAGIALLGCVPSIRDWGPGHYELRSFHSARMEPESVALIARIAWSVAHFKDWVMFAGLIASAVLTIGAVRSNSRSRRRCYRWYLCLCIATLTLILLSGFVQDHSNISYRWVARQPPVVGPWETPTRADLAEYWEIPVLALIANPAVIVLALRRLAAASTIPAK